MGFNVFDPSQWADSTGFFVVAAMGVLTLVGALAKLAASGKWADWLDETRGRGSISDPWEQPETS